MGSREAAPTGGPGYSPKNSPTATANPKAKSTAWGVTTVAHPARAATVLAAPNATKTPRTPPPTLSRTASTRN
jgi:hypothetical protein